MGPVLPSPGGIGVFASLSARVGACADELRLMGGGCGSILVGVSGEGKDSDSLVRTMCSVVTTMTTSTNIAVKAFVRRYRHTLVTEIRLKRPTYG